MKIEDIIREYLEHNKCDGLINSGNECICTKDNLMHCCNKEKEGSANIPDCSTMNIEKLPEGSWNQFKVKRNK